MRRVVLLAGMCGALSACDALGGAGYARSRCGSSYVTDVYWGAGAGAGAVGAWYGGTGPGDGAYYYGDWYDPGDAAYDPGTNSGGLVDPNDSSGWNQPDNGSSSDPGADPSADPNANAGAGDTSSGDTSGGDTSGGDTSGASFGRLHLNSTPVSRAASGCFSCTMGCRTDVAASATGRQAMGVSGISYDDACNSAVGQLAQWSHDTQRERLTVCQRIAAP